VTCASVMLSRVKGRSREESGRRGVSPAAKANSDVTLPELALSVAGMPLSRMPGYKGEDAVAESFPNILVIRFT